MDHKYFHASWLMVGSKSNMFLNFRAFISSANFAVASVPAASFASVPAAGRFNVADGRFLPRGGDPVAAAGRFCPAFNAAGRFCPASLVPFS